jgi:hypothetical protein
MIPHYDWEEIVSKICVGQPLLARERINVKIRNIESDQSKEAGDRERNECCFSPRLRVKEWTSSRWLEPESQVHYW